MPLMEVTEEERLEVIYRRHLRRAETEHNEISVRVARKYPPGMIATMDRHALLVNYIKVRRGRADRRKLAA